MQHPQWEPSTDMSPAENAYKRGVKDSSWRAPPEPEGLWLGLAAPQHEACQIGLTCSHRPLPSPPPPLPVPLAPLSPYSQVG
jgi:hypothetical protein